MNQSILVIRIIMVLFCYTGGYAVAFLFPDINVHAFFCSGWRFARGTSGVD